MVKTAAFTKFERLKDILASLQEVVVAYSGGVDSTFLLWVSFQVLGPKARGVLIDTPLVPPYKKEEALKTSRTLGLPVEVLSVDIWQEEGILANGPKRCYFCKKFLFSKLKALAGAVPVCDGTNADEVREFRPGLLAKEELGVRSPLYEAGLTKKETRELSAAFNLPTAWKPSYSCLATRIPQGMRLVPELLERVGELERSLEELGFSGLRARHHGDIVRLEFEERDFPRVLDPGIRKTVLALCKKAGYRFATLDLAGYQKGSMDGG
jgi:uncharacterized protein